MKPKIYLTLTLLLLSGALMAQQQDTHPSTEAKISGSGCVTAGVEAGCLVLTDTKTKKKYNLFIASGKKPKVDMAITFEGEPGGPNICMEGDPVKVTTWKQIKMHCPAQNKDTSK